MTGRVAAASHVVLASVPAFCHWVEKPSVAAVGTGRIWFLVVELTSVSSTLALSTGVKSFPSSACLVVSGLSLEFPACPGEQPVVLRVYVSYCDVKAGELPAVPFEARR